MRCFIDLNFDSDTVVLKNEQLTALKNVPLQDMTLWNTALDANHFLKQ